MMWPTIDPTIGKWILAGCFVVFIISMIIFLWPGKEAETQRESGLSQETRGDASHAISAGRDVHIHASPAPTQPRKSPHVESAINPWDDPTFRLTSAASTSASVANAVPDMELQEVCARLYDSLGGPAQLVADFETRVDLEIKDNVRFRGLHTWGRRKPGHGLNDVWKDAWLTGDFSHKRGSLIFRHPDNPTHPVKWTDLRFNRGEVDKWLPPKPEYGMIVG